MIRLLILAVAAISALVGCETLNAHPFFDMNPYEVRNRINDRCMSIDAEVPEVGSTEDRSIEAAGRKTPLRIYTPSDGSRLPLILLIHGGAWVAGNLDTHDNLARYLCKNARAVVLSVGYQTAPEGKFPVPLEQCYDTLLWAATHTQQLRTDGRIAIVGDSAGGNMAAALCLVTRDRQGPQIDFQVLINPAPNLTCDGTIERQGGELDALRWQAMMYVENPEDVNNPYVSPSLADLTGLPAALIVLAEFDALRQDGQHYADKLHAADVPTSVYCQRGTDHLAGHSARASKAAQESLDTAVTALREAFHQNSEGPA